MLFRSMEKLLGTVVTERLIDVCTILICLGLVVLLAFNRMAAMTSQYVVDPIMAKIRAPHLVLYLALAIVGLALILIARAVLARQSDSPRAARFRQLVHGFLPTLPQHDSSRYWFTAVSILGASISPYLFFFYSSGAIEDEWTEEYVGVNRVIATGGMSFGSLISIAVLVLAATLFLPRGIKVAHYDQLPMLLVPVFGRTGFWLFVASLGIACLGAAMEITLEIAYLAAQGMGWNWSENQRPLAEARFSLVYTITILLGMMIVMIGIDPLKLTIFSMALTAATLPVSIVPFLFLMNDKSYVRGYRNGWISNTVVVLIIGLAFILAIVTIPLQIFGGS